MFDNYEVLVGFGNDSSKCSFFHHFKRAFNSKQKNEYKNGVKGCGT